MVDAFGVGFSFKDWVFEVETGRLQLNYQDDRFGAFTEGFEFPNVKPERIKKLGRAFEQAMDCLHWMAGVSYYKTALAKDIRFEGRGPSPDQAAWLTQSWQAGLGELGHQNGLGWLDHIQFPATDSKVTAAASLKLKPKSLVAIGGGKDSLVSIEALKAMDESATLFQVGNADFIEQVGQHTGLPLLQIRRQVDPRLRDANAQGAFNGHVPITAINACVAVVAALLYDFDAVVFSNERSANSGNLKAANGQWVNHQYSKSLDFELAWQNIIHQHIATDLSCFSLLRPFSELKIIQRFAQHPEYFAHFSSCNRNFHLLGSQNIGHHWCGECPKCAFVFLCLAPFVDRATLLEIFQKDLFADVELSDLFAALLGWNADKPFECVGEAVECRMAVHMLKDHADWNNHPWVQHWQALLPPLAANEQAELFMADPAHNIPNQRRFCEVLCDET